MKKAASAIVLCATFVCAPGSFAQTKVASVEGITEYRLDNGMKVLLFPDSSKPKVTVNVTYLVGSRHEGSGETGMAHLLEHMLFKGTTKREGIMQELANHGADFNGTTSYDRTNYFETVTATDENLRWALEMEADRMVNSRVSRKDLDTEMTVVRNEFERGENSAGRVLEERVLSTAFLWHGYGRSTIGARSDIEKVPIERLQAFYRNYYQPDNAILIIAGKFDEAKTLGWIKETFGAITKPSRTLIPTYTEEPVQDGEREVTLQRVGDNQILMTAFHTPAGSDIDSAALDVLSSILTDPPSGRLYKALVESKKAISVAGENNQLRDPGYLLFRAEVRKEGNLNDVHQTMQSVLEGVVKEPPNKDEVDRILTRRKKDFELFYNNSERVARLMSEWASMGDWRLMFLDRDRTEKVTPQDVARVAKDYLKASNRTVGRFIPTEIEPERTQVRPAPDVSALVADYKGRAAVEEGEAFDPSPANIDSRTQRVTLPNGLKLVLLPKKSRGGAVTATVVLHYGNEKNVFGKGTAAQFAGGMLMRGTANYTRQQLQDALDKLKAQMNAGGSENDATLNVTTVRDSLAASVKLAAEVLRRPSFPETEFEQMRQASLGRVESSLKEPGALAPQALRKHLIRYPAGDPRAVVTFAEEIDNLKKVTLADVKKFHSDFYGASHAEVVVVGDFDPAEIRKVVEAELGDWKSPAEYQLLLRTRDQVDPVNQMIETPDKANAVFMAGFTLAMNEDNPDYPALMFANRMFGDARNLKSRLWRRIREKEGFSYGVGSALAASLKSEFTQFMVQATCVPQNILKVEDAFKDELAKLLRDGFDPQEVAEAKKAFLEQLVLGRSQDATLARLLARNAQFDWTMQRDADQEAKVASLTVAQLNEVVKKYLNPTSISYFKAGDFKKAGITQ
ncbi:MAG: pitrilysin family protein [Bryobacteraceae bacterium]